MNRTANSFSADYSQGQTLKRTHCLHCGDELVPGSIVESNGNLFCCIGCRSVYEFLHQLGLEDYYKVKETFDEKQKKQLPIEPDSSESYEYLNQDNFVKLYTTEECPLKMNFYIEGIHCAACLWLIERIPERVPDVESVSLNMSTNVAEVTFTKRDRFSAFPEILKRFGYKAHPIKIDEEAKELKNRENRKSLLRLAVAAVCAGNIMLLSAAIYSGATGTFAKNFGLINLILSIPVVTYSAFPFYRSVFSSIRAKRTTIDIPIVFVIMVGFVLSAYNYLKGSDQVYFDSITVFIFLLLTSRYFLKSIQERVSGNQPLRKTLFSSNRTLVWDEKTRQYFFQPIASLKSEDKVKLTKGDWIPVDGKLLSPNAQLNLSVLTGENIPQTALRDDDVFAGSILESDEAVIKAEKTGKSTRIGKILDEVEKSYQSKINFSTFSDNYATVFTMLVAVVSIGSFILVSSLYSPSEALKRTIAFILIACPCAFVFALPLSLGLSLQSAIENGLLIKDTKVFEKLQHLENIFFDKTGTLTKGVFKILNWNIDELSPEDLAAILAIERQSNHPIARAIVAHLSDKNPTLPEVEDFKHIYTKGIEARVSNHVYKFISDRNISRQNDINGIISTKILVYKDEEPISEILLGDSLKEDAKYVVDELRAKGFNIYILSGDKENNVKQVSEKLSISHKNVFWEQTPEQKSKILKFIKNSMMIGDGLNDAGALSSAEIGVAIQGSVEESLKVSDVYVLNNDLFSIVDLLEHSNATVQTINRNRVFSVVYNLTAGTIALLGYINPLVAAILMPVSSLLLIGSTLYGKNITTVKEKRRVYA
ncbi:MAG TPA: heavy metal translocating P-type ATPase metal-binding domain-containing protein [Thermodesulfobacteriota bacterium]|nr:heavy metal translocating P-type ATPase metal-binding domain-containing protein [Thermodesulfobacteriota bacterium]